MFVDSMIHLLPDLKHEKIKACLQNLIAIFSSWSLIQLFDFFYEIKHSLNSWLNASLVLNLGVKKIQLVTGISYEFVMYAMISFDMPTLLSYLKKWVPWIKNHVLTSKTYFVVCYNDGGWSLAKLANEVFWPQKWSL